MKHFSSMILGIVIVGLASLPAYARDSHTFAFTGGSPGSEAKAFSSLVGNWHMDRDGSRTVYAADGRNWEQGLMAAGVKEKAKALYGDGYAEFINNLEIYRYFPLSVCKECSDFGNGTIEVSFKTISGRIDQAAGIAFGIKPIGEYFVIRANALENNLVLFRMAGGRRSSVAWVRNVPTPPNRWHTLKVVITGKKIEGYLNNIKYLDHTWKENINGRIGLWSKADSYVFFDNVLVERN